jgi:hypothetical protein
VAVIDPADLPEGDPRPIFDRAHAPGGPWHRYRARQTIEAVRVGGPFLIRRADGMLVERNAGWIGIDVATGDPQYIPEAQFADAYEIEE